MNEKSIINTFTNTLLEVLKEGTYEGQYFYCYDQKYHLEFDDGSYERSPELLIHHVLYYEGIYQMFCNASEINNIQEQIDDDVIYRNDEYMELLDDLHSAGKEIITNFKDCC